MLIPNVGTCPTPQRTCLRGPRLLKELVVVTEVERRRRRLLRSELELYDVRGPGFEPDTAKVLVTTEKYIYS